LKINGKFDALGQIAQKPREGRWQDHRPHRARHGFQDGRRLRSHQVAAGRCSWYAHKQRIVLVELKKKRVLFLRIGPLAFAPYWFNLMSGLGVP
jgi:hypothetical protein